MQEERGRVCWAEGMHVWRPRDERECGEFGKVREVLLSPNDSPQLSLKALA